MSFEIGDSFKIVDGGINPKNSRVYKYNCKDQKEFIITKLSKSGHSVYYEDNRTNKKCKCKNCSDEDEIKCIGVVNIELVSKRLQRERNLKLKRLGI
jgi:hypothetical protein